MARVGPLHMVAGRFPRPVGKALKQLALDEDTTIQELLAEAIDRLFAACNLPSITDMEARDEEQRS